jgi:hypothetical protein
VAASLLHCSVSPGPRSASADKGGASPNVGGKRNAGSRTYGLNARREFQRFGAGRRPKAARPVQRNSLPNQLRKVPVRAGAFPDFIYKRVRPTYA